MSGSLDCLGKISDRFFILVGKNSVWFVTLVVKSSVWSRELPYIISLIRLISFMGLYLKDQGINLVEHSKINSWVEEYTNWLRQSYVNYGAIFLSLSFISVV